jgi:hypothetical protein
MYFMQGHEWILVYTFALKYGIRDAHLKLLAVYEFGQRVEGSNFLMIKMK